MRRNAINSVVYCCWMRNLRVPFVCRNLTGLGGPDPDELPANALAPQTKTGQPLVGFIRNLARWMMADGLKSQLTNQGQVLINTTQGHSLPPTALHVYPSSSTSHTRTVTSSRCHDTSSSWTSAWVGLAGKLG